MNETRQIQSDPPVTAGAAARVSRTAAAWARSQFASDLFGHRLGATVKRMVGVRATRLIDMTRQVDLVTRELFDDIHARLAAGLSR